MTPQKKEKLTMSDPKVSIIVPIYNTENELPRCIQSIQKQTFSDIEIILVDDGSTDSCPQICDNYAEHDPRIRVLHKENGGVSDTRNTGILAARGEYILQVDSDDYIETNAVEQLLLGDEPGIDLIVGAYFCWIGDQRMIYRHTGLEEGKIYTSKDFIINIIKNHNFMATPWGYMYRRKYLLENKLLYPKGIVHEDLYLALDLFLNTDRIKYIDFPFYNYVKREGSITSSNSRKAIKGNLIALKHWKQIVESIQDKTLQKFLYYEFTWSYLFMCYEHKLIGWWIPGMNFPYTFIHTPTLEKKKQLLRFELKTLYYKYILPNDKTYRLPEKNQ